jgi:tetratricopeptide (TPR) repeat protein
MKYMQPDVQHGEELFAQGKVGEARDWFLSILAERPGDPEALNDLGVVSLTQGKEDEAETYFLRALEAAPEFADARLNLVNLYLGQESWNRAAESLEAALRVMPEDMELVNRLFVVYTRLGRQEDAKKLLDESQSLSLMRSFIDGIWTAVEYWELVEDMDTRDRLEGLAGMILGLLDGKGGPGVPFKLTSSDPAAGRGVALERLSDFFYYRRGESVALNRRRQSQGRVLRPEELRDWANFRYLLHREIRDEGGCLGDFTQTRKVLRQYGDFKKYDIESTLQYFMDTFGPCDCHVYRSED